MVFFGLYVIVPLVATHLDMNAWGASMTAGAPIKTSTRVNPPTDNEIWQVVALNNNNNNTTTESDLEYLIINKQTGYFLTAKPNEPTAINTPQISPTDPLCHWYIQSYPDRKVPTFVIVNKARGGYATVAGGSQYYGTDVVNWVPNGPITESSRWTFIPQSS